MNIKLTITYNDKEYKYNFEDKTPYMICEEFKKILKELEKLKVWNKNID